MKKFLCLSLLLFAFSLGATAQEESPDHKTATDDDKIAVFDKDGKIKRGEALGDSKKVSLTKILKNPKKYEGKMVRVKGYVVRSCKKEGCWAELGTEKDSKQSIRVNMKDHSFFIPLKSAGYKALTEGTVHIKVLTKEQVEHYKEEGAKFDNINEDGTVTVVSFLATGIELSKGK